MSKGKTFAKNTLFYGLGKVLTLLVSVFLLPLYTSRIAPDNYGFFETTRSIIDLLIPFLCVEMWCGVFRLYFSKSNDETEKKRLLASSFYFCTFIAALISLGFFLFGILGFTKKWPLSILVIFSTTYSLLFLYFARSLKKNFIFSISGILASVVNAATGILLVVVFKVQEEAMFLALSFGYFAQIIMLFFCLKLWKVIKINLFSFKTLKRIILFSWPLGISTVLYYISKGFIQLLISIFISDSYVAFFSVSLRFTSIIVAFANILSMSWMDIVFSEKDDIKRKELLSFWTPLFFRFFSILSLFMIPFIGIAFNILVGEQYREAFYLLPVSMACSYFILSAGILINPLHSENKTKYDMYAKAISAIFAVATFFSLFKFSPLFSGIIAYFVGCFVEYLSLHIICNKVIGLKISFSPTILFSIIYIISALTFIYLPSFVSFALALIILIFGFVYCWDVISVILKKFYPFIPTSLHLSLKEKVRNNKKIVFSIVLFTVSFVLCFTSIGFSKDYWLLFLFVVLSLISLVFSLLLVKNNTSERNDTTNFRKLCFDIVLPISLLSFAGFLLAVFDYYFYGYSPQFIYLIFVVLFYMFLYFCFFKNKIAYVDFGAKKDAQ